MSEREKLRAIQKLYKGSLAGKVKPNKVYVVARKFQAGKVTGSNAKIKLVDPRMKKEKRAQKARDARKKKRR